MNQVAIFENDVVKIIKSDDFNMKFLKSSGYTVTYGKTAEEDPEFCPVGPIIADIEISTVCNQGCPFCYKSNTGTGDNMSFETFKSIFHKLPRSLTQIAFGIGDINANPDLKDIFNYCKNNEYQYIVPNVTVNGSQITDEWLDYLSKTCGAVAVSLYDNDNCFNTVKGLSDRGLKQVNIHCVLSEQTFEKCMDLIDNVKSDPRLKGLNAVVFLMLKNKGRGEKMARISDDKYKLFVDKLMTSKINYGFDSCGSGRLLAYGVSEEIKNYIEPCESGLFSMYVNTEGKFFPCSFTEGVDEWKEGIDLTSDIDFMEDIWYSPRVKSWRRSLIGCNRQCPKYRI